MKHHRWKVRLSDVFTLVLIRKQAGLPSLKPDKPREEAALLARWLQDMVAQLKPRQADMLADQARQGRSGGGSVGQAGRAVHSDVLACTAGTAVAPVHPCLLFADSRSTFFRMELEPGSSILQKACSARLSTVCALAGQQVKAGRGAGSAAAMNAAAVVAATAADGVSEVPGSVLGMADSILQVYHVAFEELKRQVCQTRV